jgi:hypothetical protein
MAKPTRASHLPEGRLAGDYEQTNGVVVYSLTAHALEAIARHRWIESEKTGGDCGRRCEEAWIDHYWNGWARSKLLEHLIGWRCWGAFALDSFALLRRQSLAAMVNESTIELIGTMLASGAENLDIINWAVQTNQELDPILTLLERIDINSKRQRLLTKHIRLFI